MKTDNLRLRVRRLLHGQRKIALIQIAVAMLLIGVVGYYATRPILFISETFGIDDDALIMSAAIGIAIGFIFGILIWQVFISCMILFRRGVIFRALDAFAAQADDEKIQK